jgi:hypothetical protein
LDLWDRCGLPASPAGARAPTKPNSPPPPPPPPLLLLLLLLLLLNSPLRFWLDLPPAARECACETRGRAPDAGRKKLLFNGGRNCDIGPPRSA